MEHLITPDEVPHWIPGELTVDSSSQDWEELSLKGYEYPRLDVLIPTMRDYMIVAYVGGHAKMSRQDSGGWESHRVEPGIVSILTRGEQSRWAWDQPIQVSHIYLSQPAISRVAGEVFDRDIRDIEIGDQVGIEDRVFPALMMLLENEVKSGGVGGNIYVDALRNQICVHLLRRFAQVKFIEEKNLAGFSSAQRRVLIEYVHENIDQKITLEKMAELTRTSVTQLIRRFHADFSCPPHTYVMNVRIEHAKKLLSSKGAIPLKVVAAESGFSDQSHMTRVFSRLLKMTPFEFKKNTEHAVYRF